MTVPRPSDPRGPQATVGADALRAAVDAALAGLDRLDERPLAEHVTAFERVHAALGDALGGSAGPRGA